MDRPVLVFDGDCGFCTRMVGWVRLLDGRKRIETLPYQQRGVPAAVGATEAECAASVQWRGADGQRLDGAAAANAALGVVLGASWPSTLYRRSAGLQERLYGWIAEHRHRLPGVQPWCRRYPDACG